MTLRDGEIARGVRYLGRWRGIVLFVGEERVEWKREQVTLALANRKGLIPIAF
jgi:hypothetical protein